MAVSTFHWADYVVFAGWLVICLAVGVYFMVKGSHKSKEEYLLAGTNMNFVAVGSSLLATGLSAVFILGGRSLLKFKNKITFL